MRPDAAAALTSAEFGFAALRAHTAMIRRLRRPDGLYRRSSWLGRIGVTEHLWPVACAFVATLDVAGIPAEARSGFDIERAIAADLRGLGHYWDSDDPLPAYRSDVHRTPWSGDRYYDDNAWVGLGLVQLERQCPGAGPRGRASELFAFAEAGWDKRPDTPHPGGVFWVEQGRGAGRCNHDRNTVSNAPNAQLGLQLDALSSDGSRAAAGGRMLDWVARVLSAPDGLYFDKLRGDGTLDRAQWSYNQGSMIGAGVLRDRGRGGEHLAAAETLAGRALDRFAGRYFEQAPAFNAIFFRNLLVLHAATRQAELQARITAELRGYAAAALSRTRADGLLPRADGRVSVLDQSALVSVLALSAWAPEDYSRLA